MKRIVDGEGIWRSKKLKSVPVDMRAEFANILPVAEANGAFEYDSDAVWANVYSYNRPDVSAERCGEILAAFVDAGMISVYEESGRTYGYFEGSDKPGRLPSPAHQARYSALPPVPVRDPLPGGPAYVSSRQRIVDGVEVERTFHGVDVPLSTGNRSIDSEIESRCRAAMGQSEDRIHWKKELRIAVQTHGYDLVLQAFDLWAESQTTFTGRRPITTFLKALPSLAHSRPSGATVKSAALQQVEDAIALASNNAVVFSNQEKPHLALLVKEHGPDAVISIFRDFYAPLDDYGQKWANRNFIEKAPQFLRTLRIQREERERQEAFAATQVAALQEQSAVEAAKLAAQETETDAAADEAFAEFK